MKAVMITGVSSGIGYDATGYLISRGYTVFGSVRTEQDRQRLCGKFPHRFEPLIFDVTDRDAIHVAAEIVKQKLNGIHLCALVNNAGLVTPGPMCLLSEKSFEHHIHVNLLGAHTVTNAFLPLLGMPNGAKTKDGAQQRPITKPGRIINLSSVSGIVNTPLGGAYCVSKHALESLTELYCRELFMYGIKVISVRPGPVASRIWEKNLTALDPFADSDYGPMIEASKSIVADAQRQALPLEVTSRLIHRIIETKRPRRAYLVNRPKLPTILLAHVFPAWLVDLLMRRALS